MSSHTISSFNGSVKLESLTTFDIYDEIEGNSNKNNNNNNSNKNNDKNLTKKNKSNCQRLQRR